MRDVNSCAPSMSERLWKGDGLPTCCKTRCGAPAWAQAACVRTVSARQALR